MMASRDRGYGPANRLSVASVRRTRLWSGLSIAAVPAITLLMVETTAEAQPAAQPVPPESGTTTTPVLPPPAGNGTIAPLSEATSPVAPASAVTPEKKDSKWYDVVNVGAFVDGYYSHNWRRPRPNTGANLYQPYTGNSGFNVSWVGIDASVDPDPVGATLQLRFGPSVPFLALDDFKIPGGIGFVQNGFVSWKPLGKDGKLLLAFGKFDTVYGAEVAQSHLNINYTRGYLYNLAQPFFHTGLRAEIGLGDMLTLKLLAVNGWNNTIDNNRGKSFGAQLVAAPAEGATFSLGYLGGPEEADVIAAPPGATVTNVRNVGADSRWRHLVDVVGDVTIGKDFRVVVNGDYVTQTIAVNGNDTSVSWFGASLLARYALSDVWALGARGEIVRDKDGQITFPNTGPLTLYTGTLTLEAAPHKMLLIRLDNRIDAADKAVFQEGLRGTQETQFTTTLGVVAKTN